jgi:hypothetical protein
MWKQRLRSAIDKGKSDFTVDAVGRDNVCEFGKWLYGPTVPAVNKSMPEYEAVKSLHARFHTSAARVLAAALGGGKAEAEAMLDTSAEFSHISGEFTRAMMAWKTKAEKK